MKIFTVMLSLLAMASTCFADQFINGNLRKDGTYVQQNTRPSPDDSYTNNNPTSPNTNPYFNERNANTLSYNDRTPDYNKKNYGNSDTVDNNNMYPSPSQNHRNKSLYKN